MTASAFVQPTAEQLAAFRDGDPVAVDAVITLMLPQLQSYARKHWGADLDEAEIDEAVSQACLETWQKPGRYDSTRSLLSTYLINLTGKRIIDARRRLIRDVGRSVPLPETHAIGPSPTYNRVDDDGGAATRVALEQFFAAVEPHLEGYERELLATYRADSADPAVEEAILTRHGFAGDMPDIIKNARARLRRKLRRLAEEHGFHPADLLP